MKPDNWVDWNDMPAEYDYSPLSDDEEEFLRLQKVYSQKDRRTRKNRKLKKCQEKQPSALKPLCFAHITSFGPATIFSVSVPASSQPVKIKLSATALAANFNL